MQQVIVLNISKLENALKSLWYRETTVNKMVILKTMVSKYSVKLIIYKVLALLLTNLIGQQLSLRSSTWIETPLHSLTRSLPLRLCA